MMRVLNQNTENMSDEEEDDETIESEYWNFSDEEEDDETIKEF